MNRRRMRNRKFQGNDNEEEEELSSKDEKNKLVFLHGCL